MSQDRASLEPDSGAALAWVRDRAAGQLDGLGWVDTSLDSPASEFSASEAGFRALSSAATLPPAVRAAAQAAQARGEPTLVEGIQLITSEAAWLVQTRALLFAPDSPEPRLLASLVESLGLDHHLHRHDPTRLQRLVARLRPWQARRGEAQAALDLLASALGDSPDERLVSPARLPDEVFACRSARWWAARQAEPQRMPLRISGGWTRFQPPGTPAVHLRAEDVLVEWQPGRAIHRGLLRLLPVWACYRVAIPEESPT